MGTTLYLHPLGGELEIKKVLGGTLAAGNTCINVPWPHKKLIPSNDSAHTGKVNLLAAIVAALPTSSTLDPIKIAGQSGGGQVMMKTIREDRAAIIAAIAAAGKTAGCIEWYIFGCPEQKFTGTSYLYTAQDPPIYPGDPTKGGKVHDGSCPTPSGMHGGYGVGYGLPATVSGIGQINVISLQYDGWSHAPTNRLHAQLNKLYTLLPPQKVWDYGIFPYLKSAKEAKGGPHGKYDIEGTVPLTDPSCFVFTDTDGVKYWYIRTYPFPGYDTVKAIRFLARNLDMKYRSSIDTSAYGMTDSTHGTPVTITAPDYTAVISWFPLT